MKRFVSLALCFLFASVVQTQPAQSRLSSELKGIRRIYVDTGNDVKSRERIVKKIEKAKIGVEILTSPEGAEFVLTFVSKDVSSVADVKVTPALVPNMPARKRIVYQSTESGEGTGYIPLSSGEHRDLFHWSGGPAKMFASYFITEYKKANGLK